MMPSRLLLLLALLSLPFTGAPAAPLPGPEPLATAEVAALWLLILLAGRRARRHRGGAAGPPPTMM